MNPFEMVLTELWNMLLAHPQFVRDVKEQNRIHFDDADNRSPIKSTIAAADLPEVAILTSTGTANIMSTSSTSMTIRQYSIMVSTGDYRYTEILAKVEWYVFCAMVGWKNRISGLQWKGKTFAKRLNVVFFFNDTANPEKNRNIKGWSAVWVIEVEMHLQTSDLLAELNQGDISDDAN